MTIDRRSNGQRRRVHIQRAFADLEERAYRHGIEIATLQSIAEYFTGFFTQSLERTMADLQALNDKIAELKRAVTDDEAADDANEQRLDAVIVDLRAQLAGSTLDLTSQLAELDAIKASLHGPAGGETEVPVAP